jgi:tetratricopeptide (TPR) repeat protein
VTSSNAAPSPWTTAAILLLLLSVVVGLQVVRERTAPLQSGQAELLYVRSPEALKRMALSYEALLADVYWIRAIQAYGGARRSTESVKNYGLLYPLLDLTTSLDPRLNVAYTFGAVFLAEPPPGGPGRSDQAIRLLQKGLRAQPDNWRLAQALGFVFYWWREDYRTAAEWFDRAAKMPGAPIWMAPLAAVTLAQGGNRAASRQMWQHVAQTETDEWFRNEAARRLQQLDALDQLDALNGLLVKYRAQAGRDATHWSDLVRAGLLRGVPHDPSGLPYRIDGASAAVDPGSRLLPLPNAARLR